MVNWRRLRQKKGQFASSGTRRKNAFGIVLYKIFILSTYLGEVRERLIQLLFQLYKFYYLLGRNANFRKCTINLYFVFIFLGSLKKLAQIKDCLVMTMTKEAKTLI